ncbi:MAG: LysR family transcriptional regulator, partial [Pseudomonadota bacterium]
MHLPTLRQLEFLCAISEHGSFSKAADASFVTQPTLSSAIKELEAALGVQLVERETRGATLTNAGEAAVERARTILSDTADLVSAAQQAGAPLTGPFRLGAIPTVAPFLLPRTLKALRTAYPELKLYLREDQTERLLDDLRG